MNCLNDLHPGDTVVFIDPRIDRPELGTFVKINSIHDNNDRDITVLNLIGQKTTIKESSIAWDKTTILYEQGIKL